MISYLLFNLALGVTLTYSKFERYHDYCVIGAGPAGLQMGYFLGRANRDYLVFEKSNVTGSFFSKYPRHRRLISINKRFTGTTNKESNLRHDWNSLLSHDPSLLFRHYSDEMFPMADDLLRYLNDFHQKLEIKVQFNTEISKIRNTDSKSSPPVRSTADNSSMKHFDDQHGNTYSCKVLIVATGMWKPYVPWIKGIELAGGYENFSIDPRDYAGKSVLIMGSGNAALETAKGIYGVTSYIHVVSPSTLRLSYNSHYVGDIRAVNLDIVDTYQLKSLDGIAAGGGSTLQLVIQQTTDNKLKVVDPILAPFVSSDSKGVDLAQDNNTKPFVLEYDNHVFRHAYDKILRCVGFTFDKTIFRDGVKRTGPRGKFPAAHPHYEAVSMPGVFFAGAVSHSLDYRKSAGGFIHGFRYTARTLFRLLEWKYEGVPWPVVRIPVSKLPQTIMKRMNEASGLFQMFEVLCDVFLFSDDGQEMEHLEEFPLKLLDELPQRTGRARLPDGRPKKDVRMLVLVFQYGANFSSPHVDTLRAETNLHPQMAHTCNFLHPVFYFYDALITKDEMGKATASKTVIPRPKQLHHTVEDFYVDFDCIHAHLMPLRHFLDNITAQDLRMRFSQNCFLETMTRSGLPSPACSYGLDNDQLLSSTSPMKNSLIRWHIADRKRKAYWFGQAIRLPSPSRTVMTAVFKNGERVAIATRIASSSVQ